MKTALCIVGGAALGITVLIAAKKAGYPLV